MGRFLVIGRRNAMLPLCHVDDVARAVSAALAADGARGAYNIVDDPLTQGEWMSNLVAQGACVRPTYVPPLFLMIPAAGLEVVWRLARRGSPSLSRYKIRRATENLRYDTSRARRELGWTPEIGVRSLVNGLRQPLPANTSPALGQLAVERNRRSLP
jgi:nucleoside-diphosphate-sugar epimerase